MNSGQEGLFGRKRGHEYPGQKQDQKRKMGEIEDRDRSLASTSQEVKFKVESDSKLLFHYQQLFPHIYLPSATVAPVPMIPPSFQFSKNCQNFNRLFHSSFDEDASSSPKPEPLTVDCNTKREVKVEEGSEILIEIEIETEEAEAVPDSSTSIASIINLFDGKRDISEVDVPVVAGHGNDVVSETASDPKSQSPVRKKSKTVDEFLGLEISNLSTKKGRIGERKSNRLPQQLTSCKTQEAQIMRRITIILKKEISALTAEDKTLMDAFPTLVRIVRKRFEARLLSTERLKEFEDSTEVLEHKCNQLAEIISSAKYLVVYSGAGISTSANIPDFRGSSGLWTLLKNGQTLETQNVDTQILTSADPTTTHMALKQLYSDGIVKHIVSQNCDGLHLRSGIPKMGLSEIHGNMYIEVCGKCGRDYVRTFDVAENTRRHEHRTGRRCYNCHNPLRDTIVHFGERGKLRWPINWAGAEYNAHRADVILCIGSSLKVLRRYPWLWRMDEAAAKRPKLVIVNLMWTPKDPFAALKIHGRCDDVMTRVMQKLNTSIPRYSRLADPLFRIATPLHLREIRTRSSRELAFPENEPLPHKLVDMNNYMQFEPVFRISSAANTSDDEQSDSDNLPHGKVESIKTRSSALKKGGKKVSSKNSKGKNRIIKKGSANGWLGNLTPGVKSRKRKVK